MVGISNLGLGITRNSAGLGALLQPFAFTDNGDGSIDVTTEGDIPTPNLTNNGDGTVTSSQSGRYIYKPSGNAEDDFSGAFEANGTAANVGAGTFKVYKRVESYFSAAAAPYTPASLGSKLFAWYDFTDMSKQFQNADFTNPVTAGGQTILSIADSGGQGTGNNRGLLTNGGDSTYNASGYLTNGASHTHLAMNVPEQMTDDTTIYLMMDCASTMMPFVKEGGVQAQGFAGLGQSGSFTATVDSNFGSNVAYAKDDPLTTFTVSNRNEMYNAIATTPGTFRLFAIRAMELATLTGSGDDISFLGRALDGFGAMIGNFTDMVVTNETLTSEEELELVEFMSGRAS